MSLPAVRFRNPAWCRIFREITCYTLSILGHCFDAVSLGKAHASIDSGVNEYLVGQG